MNMREEEIRDMIKKNRNMIDNRDVLGTRQIYIIPDPNEYIRNNRPLKMSIKSYDENERRLINKGRLDMLDDIDKLLNHNVLHINRDELNHILDCKFLFEHDNTLCIQTGSDDMYWIKFDEKGVNK